MPQCYTTHSAAIHHSRNIRVLLTEAQITESPLNTTLAGPYGNIIVLTWES